MIYIDADANLATWRHIMDAGHYTHFTGNAERGDVIMRFGCNRGRYQNHYPAGTRVLNPRIVLNKRDQIQALRAGNVPVPMIFTNRTEWEAAGRPPVLTKPTIGQMGTGIRMVENPRDFGGDHIIQLYVDKQREFRAMMVGGLLAFFMEKHRPTNNDIRWNEHRGSQWGRVPEDPALRNNVKAVGEQALRALQYDFGAIDIMMDAQGTLWILEVNSRPEFGPVNSGRFVNAIRQYLGQPAGRRGQRAATPAAAPVATPAATPAAAPRRERAPRARRVQAEPTVTPRPALRERVAPTPRAERAADTGFSFCPGCGRQFPANHDWQWCAGCGRQL